MRAVPPTKPLLTVVLLLFAATSGTALAHGDLESASPEAGDTVRRVPQKVVVTYAEAPTDDSLLQARDGCGRFVLDGVSVEGRSQIGAVGDAQPGRWRVRYRVISAADGHLTQGSFTFMVKGRPKCDRRPTPGPTATDDTPTDPDDDDEGPGFPTLALGAVGVLLVGVALLVRLGGSRTEDE